MFIWIRNEDQNETFSADEPRELGRAGGADVSHIQIVDRTVSRRQLRVEPLNKEHVRLTNLSDSISVAFQSGQSLRPGESIELQLPLQLYVGSTTVDLDHGSSKNLAEDFGANEHSTIAVFSRTPDVGTLVDWFGTLINVLRSAVDSAGFYAEAARALHELFAMDFGMVLLRADGRWTIEAVSPPKTGQPSHTILNQVAETGQTVTQRLQPDINVAQSLQGMEAAVASPVFNAEGEIIAALYAARRRLTQSDSRSELIQPVEKQLVQLLATTVGTGIARLEARAQAERLQTKMELARRIHEGLFPRQLPEVSGYEFAGGTRPAADVGGDYYDALPLSGGQIGLAIADVCGHGLGPSLLMASMRATLRGLASRETDPARLLSDLNSSMYDELSRRMITLLYGVLDPSQHCLSYANAAHGPAVLHVPASQKQVRLLHEDANRNMPIGAMKKIDYQPCDAVLLEPGDLIVLGSDGLVETNPAFDFDHFCDLFLRKRDKPLADLADEVFRQVQSAGNGQQRDDDLTLLLVRRTRSRKSAHRASVSCAQNV